MLDQQIPSPSTIEIDVTDEGCNQACVHCCFGSNPSRRIRFIDLRQLLPFLASAYAHGTVAFELVGGGEPTNHPRIAELVAMVRDLSEPDRERTHVSLVTNGVKLDRVFSVADQFDWIRISLDSADVQVYERLHGVDPRASHFDKVVRNIKTLLTIVNPERVRVGYLVVPPLNHHRALVLDTIGFCRELGVKHVAFRPAFLDKPTAVEHWEEAAAAIMEGKAIYGESFVLGGIGGSWEYALRARAQPTGLCRTRPLVMVIKADGTVPSCVLFRERLVERPALGNIREGFETLWFSEAHRLSLAAVDRRDCPDVCKHFRADAALGALEAAMDRGETMPDVSARELDDPFFI